MQKYDILHNTIQVVYDRVFCSSKNQSNLSWINKLGLDLEMSIFSYITRETNLDFRLKSWNLYESFSYCEEKYNMASPDYGIQRVSPNFR